MKWTTTTALILAAGAGALGVNRLLTKPVESPEALLERLERDARTGAVDEREALRQLTVALEGPAERDAEVEAALLRARAKSYRAIGAYRPARDDLELVNSLYAPNDVDVVLEIVELISLEGRTEDARQRLQSLLRPGTVDARVFDMQGRVEARRAEEHLADAQRATSTSLAFQSAERAGAILQEIAVREDGDPRSIELLNELNGLFRPYEKAPVLEVADAVVNASRCNANARAAFSSALAMAPSPEGVAFLVRTSTLLGERQWALDAALAARAVPEVATSATIAAHTLPLLHEFGLASRARELVMAWDWRWGGDVEFYRAAATALLAAGEWSGVHTAASTMREKGGEFSDVWAPFFLSAAEIGAVVENRLRAPSSPVADRARFLGGEGPVQAMERFARKADDPEPYPGARRDAWFMVADGCRAADDPERERVALNSGLGLTETGYADRWARLAELESSKEPVPWDRVELRLTRALDAEPARTQEFMEAWVAAGDRVLALDRMTIDRILDECRTSRDGLPQRSLGPSVRWRVARALFESGRHVQALELCKRLLDEYPRLVPALDLRIEARLGSALPRLVAADVLRRIELVGADEKTDGFLSRLAVPFKGEELMRAMRAAPERFGRATAAATAAADGDAERAAALMAGVPAAERSPEVRLQRAQFRLAAGQYGGAAEDLEHLLQDPAHGGAALALLLETRIAQNDRQAVESLVRRATTLVLEPLQRLGLIEPLLLFGRPDLAGALLRQLDVPETRSPEFYRLGVHQALMAGDPARIAEAIARAEPYVADGTTEIAHILVHVRNRAWTLLPEAVRRVRAAGGPLTPLQDATLSLLEERLAQGRRLVEYGLASFPHSADWALLRAASLALEGEPIDFSPWFGTSATSEATETLQGNRRGRRDPRETLVLLLLLDRPDWRPWCRAEVARMEEQRAGRLWPQWLQLRLERSGGDDAAVERLVGVLEREFKDFGPVWDQHLARVRETYVAQPLAPELLQVRVQRVNSLTERVVEDPVEIALARASAALLQGPGNEQKAIRELNLALERERRDDFDAHFTVGALLAQVEQHGLAVNHLVEAAKSAPPPAANAAADALLEATLRAANPAFEQRARIAPEDLTGRLAELVSLFPADPLVSAAYIRHGKPSGEGSSWRGALARSELDRLRLQTKSRSLEVLRRGSTGPWIDLALEVSPDLAREIVEVELAARPGDVELWEAAARIEERYGDQERSRALYETILSIESRPGAAHAFAQIRLAEGASVQEVVELVQRADSALGIGQTRRTQMLQARLHGRVSLPRFDLIVAALESAWATRDRPDGTLRPLDAGLALVSSYLQWAQDLPRLRAFLAGGGRLDDFTGDLPTEEELANKALAVLAELAPYGRSERYAAVHLYCYAGLARHYLRSGTATATAMR